MHNLKSNFDKFLTLADPYLKIVLMSSIISCFAPNKPKMPDCEIIALALTGEPIGIDSEYYFWGKLCNDHALDFPNLIHRSNFNRHRKQLNPFISELNKVVADKLNKNENIYLVDSIPVPVCKLAGEKRS
jgi:hypothetical protein